MCAPVKDLYVKEDYHVDNCQLHTVLTIDNEFSMFRSMPEVRILMILILRVLSTNITGGEVPLQANDMGN